MSEVAFAPLARFADVVMGQSPGADRCNTEERGLPFLQGCAEFGPRHPYSDVYCSPSLRVAKAGSVLISVRAPVGTMNYADQDYCIGRGLGAFKAKSGVSDTVFLKHAVELNAAYLHRRSQGSTFAAVSTDDVKTVPIPVFKPEKQEKIGTILTGIDTAIEKTEALIAKYQQIKAGLMHDLFTRGVLPNGQLRPAREQAPELYQETAIGWIPREWGVSTLRACLLGNPTNGIYKSADQIGAEGTLMVGQTAFTVERSVDFSLCRRGVVSPAEIRNYGLAEGDILMTRVFATIEGVGLPTLVPHIPEPAVYESNMMRMQVNLCSVIPRLLFEWLKSPAARNHISSRVNASNQCSVNQSAINSLLIPIPEHDEQNWINSRIEAADKRIATEVTILEKLKKQKIGLMRDLLTGKVPAKVEEPEVVDG
ncbi:restriction endonuclease subunit S [Burkholderia sp. AU45274]|uniref:restriction endonuclease subunit S n=1 Tax=Burkholderia sp. AU45274 TaxID=3059205 RepID=UPI00264E4126|nr:restriction endonuclease subunit S [Burkholderia sp. AU45274]MDN7492379.1 restriction endonuclease subunit S [Burkholderia sp. AU45274]